MTTSQKMWDLADSFPTLRRWAVEKREAGVDFNGDHVLDALANEPWVTTGSRYALLFLLDVWNPWARHQLDEQWRNWSIVRAWGCWDDAHRMAAQGWLDNPFFP